MTLPQIVRVFFAIALSPLVKSQIGSLIAELEKRSKTNTIRWTRLENLHITLQFLAKIEASAIDLLLSHVRQQLTAAPQPIRITFEHLSFYPNSYHPRVLVLGVTPQEPLVKIADAIGQGIRLSGYQTEDKPYRAHLTLGRVKQMQSINPTTLLQTPCVIKEQMDIDEVVLFRSDPHEHGTTYTELMRIPLLAGCANENIMTLR